MSIPSIRESQWNKIKICSNSEFIIVLKISKKITTVFSKFIKISYLIYFTCSWLQILEIYIYALKDNYIFQPSLLSHIIFNLIIILLFYYNSQLKRLRVYILFFNLILIVHSIFSLKINEVSIQIWPFRFPSLNTLHLK